MNITIRFNDLLCNFDSVLTIKTERQYETQKYTIFETRLEHNIYSKYESYDRIVIRNKLTEHCDAYYLDLRKDMDIYYTIISKINGVKQNNNKRKAEDNLDIEHAFKKMKLNDKEDDKLNNKEDDNMVIEYIHKTLKRKRIEYNYESDNEESDNEEPIDKKQKI